MIIRLLDTVPTLIKSAIVKAPTLEGKGFSQYEAVFLQLADEHKTVNAFELQELLEACLPNGQYFFFHSKFRHIFFLLYIYYSLNLQIISKVVPQWKFVDKLSSPWMYPWIIQLIFMN